MKRNLVKILAIAGVAASLVACNKSPKVVTLTIDEAFAQAEDGSFSNANKKVKLENLCVYSNFGTTLVAGVPYAEGGKITDLKGIEVELPELPKWSEGAQRQGTYADVTVEGTLTDVNGRPVLKDASCVVNGEVFFTDGQRDEAKSTSTYSCAYWSSSQTVRSNFDKNLKNSPQNSGALMEGMFQLASVPSEVSASAESDFKVVFPGENTNGADPENEFAITVKFPKGLSSSAVSFYNDFFADKEVGDFILFDAISQYDNSKGGMCFLLENQWGPIYTEEVAEEDRPVILTQWSEIQGRYNGKFKGVEVPDLSDTKTFSYLLTENFSGNLEDLVGEEGIENWPFADLDKVGSFYVTANTGAAHAEEAFEEIKAKAAALTGWVLDEEVSDEIADDYYYVLKEGEGESAVVVAELNIFLQNAEVGIIFAGIRATDAEVSTFAEAIAQYESVVGRDISGFESALPDLPAAAASALTGIYMDWKGYEDVEGLGMVEFYPEFADGTFADNEAWQAAAAAYVSSLEAAGFVGDYYLPLFDLDGYFKASTGEFVYVGFTGQNSIIDGLCIVSSVILNSSKAALHLFNMAADAKWTAAGTYSYLLDAHENVFGTPQYVGTSYFAGAWGATYKATVLGYFENYVIPSVAQADSRNPIAQGNSEYYLYYLPSATEGKVIVIQIEADLSGMSDADDPYFITYVSVSEVSAQ